MNRLFKNFSIYFLFVVGLCFTTTVYAKYELPADYVKNEEIADSAVTEARAKTLEAVKALQVVIKQFKDIVDNGKEDDALVKEMMAEIRKLEGKSGSSGGQASASNADWQRKVLALIASEQGNGFKKLDKATVTKIVTAVEKNVPNAASDNKWSPILNAAKKAAK